MLNYNNHFSQDKFTYNYSSHFRVSEFRVNINFALTSLFKLKKEQSASCVSCRNSRLFTLHRAMLTRIVSLTEF